MADVLTTLDTNDGDYDLGGDTGYGSLIHSYTNASAGREVFFNIRVGDGTKNLSATAKDLTFTLVRYDTSNEIVIGTPTTITGNTQTQGEWNTVKVVLSQNQTYRLYLSSSLAADSSVDVKTTLYQVDNLQSGGNDNDMLTIMDTIVTDYGLDHLVYNSVTGADIADNSIFALLVDDAVTADWDNYNNQQDSLVAISNRTTANRTSILTIDNIVDTVDSNVDAIKLQTDKLQFKETPTAPTGSLIHQYIGSEGVTLTSSKVSQWDDQVGTAHLTQTTAGNRPTQAYVRGLYSVRFDKDSDQYLDIPAGLSVDTQDCTIFIVHRVEEPDYTDTNPKAFQTDSRGGMVAMPNTTPTFSLQWSNDYQLACRTSGSTQATGIRAGYGTATAILNAGSGSAVVSYGPESSTETASAGGSVNTGWVGRLFNDTGADGVYFDGHIYEILVYDKSLTADEQAAVMDYVEAKYGSMADDQDTFIYCIGDSLTVGQKATNQADYRYATQMMRKCKTSPKIGISAIGGDTLVTDIVGDLSFINTQIGYSPFATYFNRYVVLFAGINDIIAGDSSADIIAAFKTVIASIRSNNSFIKVIGMTIPTTSSLDSNQEAVRKAVNDYILHGDATGTTHFDSVLDVASDIRFSNPLNTVIFDVDGTHYTNEGYRVIGQEYVFAELLRQGVVTEAIASDVNDLKVTLDGEAVSASPGTFYTTSNITNYQISTLFTTDTLVLDAIEAVAGSVDTDAIADAVWDEVLSGHTTAGSGGKILSDLLTVTQTGVIVGK